MLQAQRKASLEPVGFCYRLSCRDHRLFYTCDTEGKLVLADPLSLQRKKTISFSEDRIVGLHFQGQDLFVGGQSGSLYQLQIDPLVIFRRYRPAGPTLIRQIEPTGQCLALSTSKEVVLWTVKASRSFDTGRHILCIKPTATSIVFGTEVGWGELDKVKLVPTRQSSTRTNLAAVVDNNLLALFAEDSMSLSDRRVGKLFYRLKLPQKGDVNDCVVESDRLLFFVRKGESSALSQFDLRNGSALWSDSRCLGEVYSIASQRVEGRLLLWLGCGRRLHLWQLS